MKIFLFEHGEHLADVDLPAVPRIGETVVYSAPGTPHNAFVVVEIVWDSNGIGPPVRVHLKPIK